MLIFYTYLPSYLYFKSVFVFSGSLTGKKIWWSCKVASTFPTAKSSLSSKPTDLSRTFACTLTQARTSPSPLSFPAWPTWTRLWNWRRTLLLRRECYNLPMLISKCRKWFLFAAGVTTTMKSCPKLWLPWPSLVWRMACKSSNCPSKSIWMQVSSGTFWVRCVAQFTSQSLAKDMYFYCSYRGNMISWDLSECES